MVDKVDIVRAQLHFLDSFLREPLPLASASLEYFHVWTMPNRQCTDRMRLHTTLNIFPKKHLNQMFWGMDGCPFVDHFYSPLAVTDFPHSYL